MVREKVATALAAGLNVILCVGESGAERERDATVQVISRQLDAVLPALRDEKNIAATKTEQHPIAGRLVLAYEPVWAIGTGKVATPAQVTDLAIHAILTLGRPNKSTRRSATGWGNTWDRKRKRSCASSMVAR